MRIRSDKTAWSLTAGGAAALMGFAAYKAMEIGWKQIVKQEPPQTPEQPGVRWSEALLWGAASGLVAGISRILGRRGAAAVWRRRTGRRPLER